MNLERSEEMKDWGNNFSKRLMAILALVLFCNLFFFHKLGSMFVFLLSMAIFGFILMAFADKEDFKKKIKILGGVFVVVMLSSWNVVRTDNDLVGSLSMVLAAYSLGIGIYVLTAKIYFLRCLAEAVLAPLKLFGAWLQAGIRVLEFAFSTKVQQSILAKKEGKDRSWLKSILLGGIVGLPVVAILISLLSSGDLAFAKFVKDLFTEGFIKDLPNRISLSLFLAIFLSPFIFFRVKKEFYSPFSLMSKRSFVHEMTVVMVMVAVVLGTFLLVQWPYVFVKVIRETDLSTFGVATYSEYVNKGFGELLMAGGLVFALVWVGLLALRGKKEGQKTILKSVQLVVLAEFGIFMISLFRRIGLYQEYHGWSLARIYGGFFLIWIAGMTITLVARHFKQRNWVYVELAMTAMVVIFLGYFNAEKFIVTHKPPTVNGRVDYVYLSRMSADGVEGWEEAYKWARKVLVESELDKKEFLDKDDRREIAYAGMILRNLLWNYNGLAENYGSDEEYKYYIKKTLESEIKEVRFNINLAESLINDGGKSNYSSIQSQKQTLEVFEKILRTVNEGSLGPWEINYDIGLCNISEGLEFSSRGTSCYYKSSFLLGKGDRKKPSNLDKLLIYNKSQKNAYSLLEEGIGLDELIDLQKEYWNLYMKIINQPEEERDYEMDISLNSPFLK